MSTGTLGPSLDDLEHQSVGPVAINTIRTLSVDAVQAANSGHRGSAMALASVTYTLWQEFLRYDPQLPSWSNRDRFVLSVGHASGSSSRLWSGVGTHEAWRDRRTRRAAGEFTPPW